MKLRLGVIPQDEPGSSQTVNPGPASDGAAAGSAPGRRPEREGAVDLQELLGHRHRAPLQVDPTQRIGLSASQPPQPSQPLHEPGRWLDAASTELQPPDRPDQQRRQQHQQDNQRTGTMALGQTNDPSPFA